MGFYLAFAHTGRVLLLPSILVSERRRRRLKQKYARPFLQIDFRGYTVGSFAFAFRMGLQYSQLLALGIGLT